MERVRSAFNRMIKSERYSRFTLQPSEDGEKDTSRSNCQMMPQRQRTRRGGSPSFRPALPRQSRATLCYLALVILLIFSIGYLLDAPDETGNKYRTPHAETHQPEAFDKSLSDFDRPRRSAGSDGDKSLANGIFDVFKKEEMDPWIGIHHVLLQTPDSMHPNHVIYGLDDFKPTGYLAYSATGIAVGKLVYGNYGRQEDLEVLQKKNVQLKDSVFAEQVDNGAKKGASAVLIYPDPQDYSYNLDTALYGHVHLGSGDPYTTGFPSFNHTQFPLFNHTQIPPTKSSGLPNIPAQTITATMASTLLKTIGGPESDASSGFKGSFASVGYKLGGSENITVEVNNVLVNKEIHNVFGVIKGFIDPDQYVVLGAQRDAWGKGYAKATVGTSVLAELAKAVRDMVEKDGFRPRRSLVFASWSAGEYGSVGATEWLEGYMSSLHKHVVTYISLDGLLMGRGSFMASAKTMKAVNSPMGAGTVYDMVGTTNVLKPMSMDDPAYPFLAFSGIPSISFHFINLNEETYSYYGTDLDNKDHLDYKTNYHTSEMAALAAQFAGQMALRLVHNHVLYPSLDVSRYSSVITKAVFRVYKRINLLSRTGQLKEVNPNWLNRARGSFQRAASSITDDIDNTDLNDKEACRILNDRIMTVESSLLSPYVSPIETPFRHLLLGRGSHTLASIAETTDMEHFRIQLALATWNLQGCANGMVGNIWDIDEEI
ncbi:hypothetical protein KUCAC02_017382 [Chaenocephalus aceratus]|uniref:Uncharacterized protein n=1 Tax=Chaenocephalus aceratus TaxID=36190 RepID=A0ACB9W2F4_CHAAC|nr:hypothetical protein KUCAC02_017382 [Chaenocephalus aceratus]